MRSTGIFHGCQLHMDITANRTFCADFPCRIRVVCPVSEMLLLFDAIPRNQRIRKSDEGVKRERTLNKKRIIALSIHPLSAGFVGQIGH
jgi:hypothetical protein